MAVEKIYCVVVTFNRLELLKENLAALDMQTLSLDKIIIVNNCSSDGTTEYLARYTGNEKFQIINFPSNIGGSAGFSRGIKEAVLDGCDWIWVMDDDTIPTRDALEQLATRKNIADNVGFIGSKVVWTDGSSHLMNTPVIKPVITVNGKRLPFNNFSEKGVLLTAESSFVSVMINAQAVRSVGLPYAEFFIWNDDAEYTGRITRQGYYGLYANDSIVLHKTAVNYCSDIRTAPDNVAWKFFYEIRNKMFLRRRSKKNFILFFFSSLNLLRKDLRNIKKRASGNNAYKKAIVSGFFAGLRFNPAIEYLSER